MMVMIRSNLPYRGMVMVMMMMIKANLPYSGMTMVMMIMTKANLPYREAPPGTTDYSATPAEPWQQHHYDDIYDHSDDHIDNHGHHLY